MKKHKKLFIMLSTVIVAVVFYLLLVNNETIEVSTMKVYRGSLTNMIELSGSINSDDVEIIPLKENVNVLNVYVQENDCVEKGQKLAELDAEELRISLEKSKLNLEELKADLNNVSTDNSKSILLSNALSRSKEDYAKLSKDLETAEEDLNKAETLYNENVISEKEYDKYLQEVDNLNTMLKTAELNINDTNISSVENAEQKRLDISSLERQIKSINLDIDSLNKKINETVIYSSVKGIVTEFPIEQFRKTLTGEKIVIHSTENYEFTAETAQKYAVLIKEGQKSIITVEGLNTDYEGIVTHVSKTAQADNIGSQLPKVEIKIKILNPDDIIAFGYEGEAKVIIDSKEDALIVKNESIKTDDNKKFVYVLQGGSAIKKYIKAGLTDGYITNIEEGLEEKDVVIVNPPFDLVDGIKVKAVN